ncbi:MAG: CopD family protein, partial [Sporichthyaceae bacterium]
MLGGTGRALAAAGALSLVGLSAFPPLVLVPARRRLGAIGAGLVDETCRRMHRPLLVAASAALVGTAAVLVDTASGSGPLVEVSAGTRTGILLLLRICAVVLTAVVLTVGTGGRKPAGGRLVAGLAGSVVILLTFSLSSHAAAVVVDRPVAVLLDLARLSAAGVWTGGLLALALAGLPAARSVAGKDLEVMGDSAAALFSRYSLIAQVAIIIVLLTGGYGALIQITAVADLGQTWWGIALTAKLALWVSVLLFAAANAFSFVPALADRAAARAPSGGGGPTAIRRPRRTGAGRGPDRDRGADVRDRTAHP